MLYLKHSKLGHFMNYRYEYITLFHNDILYIEIIQGFIKISILKIYYQEDNI